MKLKSLSLNRTRLEFQRSFRCPKLTLSSDDANQLPTLPVGTPKWQPWNALIGVINDTAKPFWVSSVVLHVAMLLAASFTLSWSWSMFVCAFVNRVRWHEIIRSMVINLDRRQSEGKRNTQRFKPLQLSERFDCNRQRKSPFGLHETLIRVFLNVRLKSSRVGEFGYARREKCRSAREVR